MPTCVKCGASFPSRIIADDGNVRDLYRRRNCFECRPFKVFRNKGTGQAVIDWRRRLKLKAVTYKGGRCLACGYSRCVRAFKFHHIDPGSKDFSISQVTRSWDNVRAELDKCILLCGNCHDEVHAGMLDLTPLIQHNLTPEEGYKRLIDSGLIERPQAVLIPAPPLCQCGAPVTKAGLHCVACAQRAQERIVWPSSEDLRQMLNAEPCTTVARRLGVSDNAIRKRLRRHPPDH
jgi:hypothetical protein